MSKVTIALAEICEGYRATVYRGARRLYITPDCETDKAAILAAVKFVRELNANEEAEQLAREAMQSEADRIEDLIRSYHE